MMEKFKAQFSILVVLTSLNVYCFVLGFLSYFKVSDYPSWFNAQVFFFSNIISRGPFNILDQALDGKLKDGFLISAFALLMCFILGMVLTSVVLALRKVGLNEVRSLRWLKKIDVSPLRVSLLLLGVFLVLLKDVFRFVVPAVVTSMITLIVVSKVVKKFEDDSEGGEGISKGQFIDFFAFSILAIVICWLAPFALGKGYARSANISTSFPLGWSGGKSAKSDNLIWKEDDRGFWINCDEQIIYGITNDGKIFFSRDISDLDNISSCK